MGRGRKFLVRFLILFIISGGFILWNNSRVNMGDTDKLEEDIINKIKIEKVEDTMVEKITKVNLNFRSGPDTNSKIILTISKGEKVEIIETQGEWDKANYAGEEGYLFNEYLEHYDESQDNTNGVSQGSNDVANDEPIDEPKDDSIDEPGDESMKIIDGILLVNKVYGLPADYDPGVDEVAKSFLDKMFLAAKDEENLDLTILSGYRSYEYQKGLFNRYSESHGEAAANRFSARAGESEHQTGLAFDIGGPDKSQWLEESFESTEEGKWLRENAHRFGYILRYSKGKEEITGYIYEPWHFRYVGIDHASKIYDRNTTLEEYLFDN